VTNLSFRVRAQEYGGPRTIRRAVPPMTLYFSEKRCGLAVAAVTTYTTGVTCGSSERGCGPANLPKPRPRRSGDSGGRGPVARIAD
jgi:hypothetical protein